MRYRCTACGAKVEACQDCYEARRFCSHRELCPACALSPMEQRAVRVLRRVWAAVGYDTLASVELNAALQRGEMASEVKVMPEPRVTLSAEQVGEICLDAGFPKMYGADAEAAEWLASRPYNEQLRVAAQAFPQRRYGA